MNQAGRRVLLALSALAVAPGLVALVRAMPAFGSGPEALGQTIATVGPGLRHVQNMVSAVNFDFRSLDTIGEEFMLMCAVTGTVLLLRGGRGEGMSDRPDLVPGRPLLDRAESTLLAGWICAPLILVYGIYVVLHATVTPGGGFQGGAIAGSGLVLGFVAGGYHAWRRLAHSPALAAIEAAGGLLFIGSGLAVMAVGGAFMENRLPLGKAGDIVSGGVMVIENLGVGLAVCAAFLMLFLEFLEETRAPKPEEEPDPDKESGS
jgi:multicomponent Na+:H+ antiporter subunit B